jgi:membrane protease YdiL (CAAX protease family)
LYLRLRQLLICIAVLLGVLLLLQGIALSIAVFALDGPADVSARALMPGGDGPTTWMFAALAVAEFLLLGAVYALARAAAPQILVASHRRATSISIYGAAPIVALGLVFAAAEASDSGSAPTITFIAVAVVFACAVGLTEELLYRGIVQHLLSVAGGPVWTIGTGALLFGAPHVVGIGEITTQSIANAIAVTVLVGVPFGAIRAAGGGLLGLAAAHAAIDAVGFVALNSIELPEVSSAEAIAQVLTAAIASALWLWLWWPRVRRRAAAAA